MAEVGLIGTALEFEMEWKSGQGAEAAWADLLGQIAPAYDLSWTAGQRWFFPVYTMCGATASKFNEAEVDGEFVVKVGWEGIAWDCEFKHWAAPFVYWLWQQWRKIKSWTRAMARDSQI